MLTRAVQIKMYAPVWLRHFVKQKQKELTLGLSRTEHIQWGQQIISQPLIVEVCLLRIMRKVCHFNHRYTSTMRDKMREKNTGNHKISIWSPINQQDFWLSQTCNFFFKELFSSPLSV